MHRSVIITHTRTGNNRKVSIMPSCVYYRAIAQKEYIWFIGGALRAEDNKWLYRTIDGTANDLEFFIPLDYEADFLQFMEYLHHQGYIISYEKKLNRLLS